MLIDFHTHLYSYKNRAELVSNLSGSSIVSVAASEDIRSYQANKQIADAVNLKKTLVIPTFGVHPEKAALYAHSLQKLEPYLIDSKIIGEIGLDFYWVKDVSHEIQEKVFLYQMEHCNTYKKYCVIHTKGAEERIAAMLKNFPDAKPVIHWYDGKESVFKTFMERGYMTTFGCETYYSESIRNLLSSVPLNQLLAETDNPTGEPWLGGKDTSPFLIKRVYRDIAQSLKISGEKLEEIIEQNCRRILMR